MKIFNRINANVRRAGFQILCIVKNSGEEVPFDVENFVLREKQCIRILCNSCNQITEKRNERMKRICMEGYDCFDGNEFGQDV